MLLWGHSGAKRDLAAASVCWMECCFVAFRNVALLRLWPLVGDKTELFPFFLGRMPPLRLMPGSDI